MSAQMKKPKVIEREIRRIEVAADHERLYGNIDEAIKYLIEMQVEYRQYPDFGLEQTCNGYNNSDVYDCFTYTRPETDDEYEARVLRIRQEEIRAIKARADEAAKADRRRQWEKLNREFGR